MDTPLDEATQIKKATPLAEGKPCAQLAPASVGYINE